ncbi:MAG: DUF2666 family protein [Candidatus Micrarchaeia archaeon]
MDEPSEYIDFMAKYKDWISIKRLGIRADTKPEEIAHHLAGIRNTVDGKAYSFLGIDTARLDAFAESITAGKRKSYAALGEAYASLQAKEADKVIEEACNGKPLKQVAEAYLISRIAKAIGFDVAVEQLTLSKIYPELKPPKAFGRTGKSKKG